METSRSSLEQILFDAVHQMLQTETRILAQSKIDLSPREFHLISTICRLVDSGRDNRTTAVAEEQQVTVGTLSTSVSLLERKGYLERRRDNKDRRIVRIVPTELGRAAHECYLRFRREFMDRIMAALPREEAANFARTLQRLSEVFIPRTLPIS